MKNTFYSKYVFLPLQSLKAREKGDKLINGKKTSSREGVRS